MKCGSPNVWKVDQIWQWVRLSQGSCHYVLCISIVASPENKILFSYSQLLRLYTSKYSPSLFQFECYASLQGLLHFHSFCFFHLEAKNKWRLDGLKQRYKSYISETSIVFFLYVNWYQRNITEVGCELRCCYVT